MTGEAKEKRRQGLDWPGHEDAETMIGDVRLRNIEDCARVIFRDQIPGDFVECGVWRGGATIFMAGLLSEWSDSRKVWVCDSFQGCPEPSPDQYPKDKGDPHHTFKFLAIPKAEVEANFVRYGLNGPHVRFVEGFFRDSLPGPIEQIALLRADGDMYESQTQILEALYDKVSPGGFVIIDDYYNIAGSHHAVNDFREQRKVTAPMVQVDWCAAYWRK